MQYGLALPTGGECGDPSFLLELAVLAEEAGWDGVFLEDYICFQGDPVAPTCDPWVALAGIAVRTKRVRLGTMVTPISRRRPWKLAREVLGIDQLSGGRMILGVGLGDTGEHVIGDASFSSFGEVRDTAARAAMLDEGPAVLLAFSAVNPFLSQGSTTAWTGSASDPLRCRDHAYRSGWAVAIRFLGRHVGHSAGMAHASTTPRPMTSSQTMYGSCARGPATDRSTSASAAANDATETAPGCARSLVPEPRGGPSTYQPKTGQRCVRPSVEVLCESTEARHEASSRLERVRERRRRPRRTTQQRPPPRSRSPRQARG